MMTKVSLSSFVLVFWWECRW